MPSALLVCNCMSAYKCGCAHMRTCVYFFCFHYYPKPSFSKSCRHNYDSSMAFVFGTEPEISTCSHWVSSLNDLFFYKINSSQTYFHGKNYKYCYYMPKCTFTSTNSLVLNLCSLYHFLPPQKHIQFVQCVILLIMLPTMEK